jgi:hypothetical protein
MGKEPKINVKIFLMVGIFILSILTFSTTFADDGLSAAYQKAREMIRGYKSTTVSTPDPTLTSSFGPSPSSQEPPPSPIDIAVDKEIKVREERVRKLVRRREAWRVALENLQRGQNWQKDLEYYVEESQAAQIGAIQKSLGLLIGVAGPVREAIDVHKYNSAALWNSAQKSRSQLEEIQIMLYEGKLSPQKTKEFQRASDALRANYSDLTSAMKSEMKLTDKFRNLDKTGDGLLESLRWIEFVNELKGKHNLLLATKVIKDCLRDLLKDAGLAVVQNNLIQHGMEGAAQSAKLADFLIDYSYEGAKFYLAWSNIDEILSQMNNTNNLSNYMGGKIVVTTDQINSARGDLQRLQNARTTKQGRETILEELRQRELREARAAGEWFSR